MSATVNVALREDRLKVTPNGRLADRELRADARVSVPVTQQADDIFFPRGQRGPRPGPERDGDDHPILLDYGGSANRRAERAGRANRPDARAARPNPPSLARARRDTPTPPHRERERERERETQMTDHDRPSLSRGAIRLVIRSCLQLPPRLEEPRTVRRSGYRGAPKSISVDLRVLESMFFPAVRARRSAIRHPMGARDSLPKSCSHAVRCAKTPNARSTVERERRILDARRVDRSLVRPGPAERPRTQRAHRSAGAGHRAVRGPAHVIEDEVLAAERLRLHPPAADLDGSQGPGRAT